MTQQSAIILVLDRLGVGLLPPYGATWLETPNFNRLAADSLLCENVIIDSPALELAYRAYLTGAHAIDSPAADGPVRPNLGALATASKVRTVLLTDDPDVAQFVGVREFSDHVILPLPTATTSADDAAETSFAALVETAIDLLPQLQSPFVLWIHAKALAGPWDAPLELRNRFADEDDPPPPDVVTPPDELLPDDFDPDVPLGFSHAAAGQVTLLDMCLGMLLDEIDRQPWASETLLAVTSSRGFPLGQHRRIGRCDDALYAELIHVPLLLRLPAGASRLERRHTLVQPPDLFPTLVDWLQLAPEASLLNTSRSLLRLIDGRPFAQAQLALATAPGQRLLRTAAWLLRETQSDGPPRCELFVKPDDYWEVNEVASRCQEIVTLLASELDRCWQLGDAAKAAQSAELADELTHSVR